MSRFGGFVAIFCGVAGLVITGFSVGPQLLGFLALEFVEQQAVMLRGFLMLLLSLFLLGVGALKARFPEYRFGRRRRE